MTPRTRTFAIALLAIAAHLPAVRGGFVWDDDAHVTASPVLENVQGLVRIWTDTGATPQYYPLTHTSFWIERRLWGLWAPGFHAVNLLLHAGAAVLLSRALARLGIEGAWLAGAIFAVHPVHVESVAWVSERKNVLSGLFYFAAAVAFLAWRDTPPREAARRLKLSILLGAMFACALLSKTVTGSLPIVLAIVLGWKFGRVRRDEAFVLSAMALAAACAGALTAALETYQIGAVGQDWSLSPLERVLVAGRAVFFYLGKLVWPKDLSFVYPRWSVAADSLGDWSFPIAAATATAALWALRRRIGSGLLAAWASFVVTLGPALGFYDVYPMRYSFVADHFQYLASAAPIAAAASLAASQGRKLRARLGRRMGLLVPASAGLLLGALGLASAVRCGAFRDEESLWRDTLRKNPSAWMAHNNLGILLAMAGRTGEAEEHFRAAIALRPTHASAHSNLGYLLLSKGDPDTAVVHLREAVRLDPQNLASRLHLGDALARVGRFEEAILHYRVARVLDPTNAALRYNLGTLLARTGRLEQGIAELREAVRLDPQLPGARENLELAIALERARARREP
jgi:Flp pilus assembly protein TadD